QVAYDMGDHHRSIAWLEEAVDLFRLSYGSWNEEDRASLEDALDHLAFSYFMVGNVSHALSLSRELLRYDPDNARVSRNVVQYEKLLEEQGPAEPRRPRSRPHGAYEELCRGTRGPPRPPAPGLRCTYHTNGSPLLLLQPAKRETLGLRPFVALYHDFVSDAEAEAIKALAGPRLQRSVVASGEQQQAAEYRISKSAWLKDTADPAVAALERRIAAVTGLDVRAPYAEYLQVVNYGLGGHYEPHFDHATSRKSPLYRMNSGNRIATVMVYLSSVEAGGSTAFIRANVSVPVLKNAALFWWNLRRSGEGDGATLHGACPVLAGDKWGKEGGRAPRAAPQHPQPTQSPPSLPVANKWIHEHGQEFRRPCGPRPED
ncbi:P4HA3 hydroxylase, partial [Nothoprocta pentlandii]|nr:P4HA3 hydroxylase [Nothoprocta pentlandii]